MPPSDDIAQRGWSAITVRIAWTLLSMGVRVRPDVLRDARQNAVLHLEPTESLTHAEDVAEACTRRLVSRARRRGDSDPWPQDWAMPVSARWRRSLDRSMTPRARAVLKHHYADNRPLAHLASKMELDLIALEAARGGLREVVRRAGLKDGVPLEQWSPERIDRLLSRLAAFSATSCPPLIDVLDGAHRSHTSHCTRCDRARRLIRRGILTLEDLVPPSLGARPGTDTQLLAIHLHPSGRHHRAGLLAELGSIAFPVDDDVLLIDMAEPEPVKRVLHLAAELGVPSRDHIRGCLVSGRGVWSRFGLLGPLATDGITEARLRPWGTIDSIGELPEPLPEPPSAAPLWAAVLALAAVLLVLLRLTVLAPVPVDTPHNLQTAFVEGRHGHWASFDVDDDALVSVIAQTEEGLKVVLASTGAGDKAALALGDGSYRAHASGPLLIAAHPEPLELDTAIAMASSAPRPLDALYIRLTQQPEVVVAASR